MREEILRLGGEVHFHSQVTEILTEGGHVTGVKINAAEELPCEQLVLAPGHSARDTFSMLYENQFPMVGKTFCRRISCGTSAGFDQPESIRCGAG